MMMMMKKLEKEKKSDDEGTRGTSFWENVQIKFGSWTSRKIFKKYYQQEDLLLYLLAVEASRPPIWDDCNRIIINNYHRSNSFYN